MDKKGIMIGGEFFSREVYHFLITRFKESFSHASLSVERSFERLNNIESRLSVIKKEESLEYFQLLDRKKRREIVNYLKQFIVFYGCNSGMISTNFNPSWTQKEVDDIYSRNFKGMFDDALYILKFDSNGEFSKEETFREFGNYFKLTLEGKDIRQLAFKMQKDHMDAFDYALSLDNIGVMELININEKVNHSMVDKEKGFKNTNNAIFGADFSTVDKSIVPIELQKLFCDYKNNFGLELLDASEEGITDKERMKRIYNIFLKEAMFHIKLMKIHPFTDGNGRTGRIIMNKHLLDNGMAPVVITGYMRDEYKSHISDSNYEGLARMMLSSSSHELINWVIMRNAGVKAKKSEKNNAQLADLLINDGDSPKKLERIKYGLISL